MQTLNLDLGNRSYPIYIGKGLLGIEKILCQHIEGKNVAIVSNETIANHYQEILCKSLGEYEILSITLLDGEKQKNLSTVEKIYDLLVENHFPRDSTLIALGGGVVGDITGFAASTYQRGVGFIQIPTTLLAQVDSSVGGKTGVNHPQSKNMIGAFYQPKAVIIDTETLKTLDNREISAGLAEVIKYGLLADANFFSWLENNITELLAKNDDALIQAITESCKSKAKIVSEDEFETNKRALLNLGHTFGHAIEAVLGYGNWLHGEAVGCGIVMAAKLSNQIGWLNSVDLERVIALIEKTNLPTKLPKNIDRKKLKEHMFFDKKILKGELRLVLLKNIGEAVVTTDFTESALDDLLLNF